MASLIGALRVTLGADTAQFEKGMTAAQRKAAQSSSAIQKSLGGIKSAFAGIAVGITVGALAAVTRKALDYAASLGEVAQQVGVTTKQLQVFRFAASQVGISQDEMDKGLSKLNISLGQAALGAKAPSEAFAALSKVLGKDIVASSKTAGDALPLIADGLAKITDRSKRAAIEVALFGRTGAKLDTLLAGGSKAIDELARAAETMGLVLSDEQIQRADETADKLDALKQVLEARIAGVVADNADSILQLANSFASLAAGLAKFWSQNPKQAFGIMGALAGAHLGRAGGLPGALVGAAIGYIAGRELAPETVSSQREKVRRQRDRLRRIRDSKSYPAQQYDLRQGAGALERETAKLRAMQSIGSVAAPDAPGEGADVDNFLDTGGGGSKGRGKSAEQLAAEAERRRKEQLRDEFQFASEQRRNQTEILRAQGDLTDDYVERTTIEARIMDLEMEQERASLKLAVDLGDLSQARADELLLQLEEVDRLKREGLLRDEQLRRMEDEARLAAVDFDIQRQILDGEAQLAETAQERRAVELRILDLAYREERDRLERIRKEAEARGDWAEAEEARRRLGALDQRQGQDRQIVIRGTMGPMEAFLRSLPDTAEKANEALQLIAADGLQSLTDGLVEAIMQAKSLGDVFKNVAKQIIADLLRISIQRSIVGPLANAFGGLFAGSSGGGLAGMAGAVGKAKGFADGGSFRIAGQAGVDNNLVSMRLSQGEIVDVRKPGNDNGGRPLIFDLRGAVMTDDLLRQMQKMADVAKVDGAIGGAQLARQQFGKARKRALGLG